MVKMGFNVVAIVVVVAAVDVILISTIFIFKPCFLFALLLFLYVFFCSIKYNIISWQQKYDNPEIATTSATAGAKSKVAAAVEVVAITAAVAKIIKYLEKAIIKA